MRKVKVFVILTAALIFTASAFTGCKNEKAAVSKKSASGVGTEVKTSVGKLPVKVSDIPVYFPLTDSGETLKVWIPLKKKYEPSETLMWVEYEKMTGVKIDWTTVPDSARKEKYATALASGEQLDVMLRAKIDTSKLISYGEQGLIVDLNENGNLQKYAPNVWNYLQNHPDTLASVQSPDGSIWALPQVNSGAELRVQRKIFIRQDWLERVGMKVPETTEELYNVLKAFKEQDANGNGDPNDEIPLCCGDWSSFQDMLLGAFGCSNRGSMNQIVDWDPVNQKVRLIATSDGYKKMLQFMNRLYKEGLVDQETFTMTSANWATKAADDRIGCFPNTNLSSLPANRSTGWVGCTQALEGPDGFKLWAPIRPNFHSTGNFVIPATCSNIPLALKWIDYFWTDAGTLFYHYGVEGNSYVANENGTFSYTKDYYDSTVSASFDEQVSRASPYPGGSNPTVEVSPYFGGGECEPLPASCARALFEYGPEEYWPNFTFTSEENEELSSIQTDINKYTTSARTEFITGAKSFNDWDSYVKSVENMNLSKMLEIYTNAVTRYHNLVNSLKK